MKWPPLMLTFSWVISKANLWKMPHSNPTLGCDISMIFLWSQPKVCIIQTFFIDYFTTFTQPLNLLFHTLLLTYLFLTLGSLCLTTVVYLLTFKPSCTETPTSTLFISCRGPLHTNTVISFSLAFRFTTTTTTTTFIYTKRKDKSNR